jgi:hypothetical protein
VLQLCARHEPKYKIRQYRQLNINQHQLSPLWRAASPTRPVCRPRSAVGWPRPSCVRPSSWRGRRPEETTRFEIHKVNTREEIRERESATFAMVDREMSFLVGRSKRRRRHDNVITTARARCGCTGLDYGSVPSVPWLKAGVNAVKCARKMNSIKQTD